MSTNAEPVSKRYLHIEGKPGKFPKSSHFEIDCDFGAIEGPPGADFGPFSLDGDMIFFKDGPAIDGIEPKAWCSIPLQTLQTRERELLESLLADEEAQLWISSDIVCDRETPMNYFDCRRTDILVNEVPLSPGEFSIQVVLKGVKAYSDNSYSQPSAKPVEAWSLLKQPVVSEPSVVSEKSVLIFAWHEGHRLDPLNFIIDSNPAAVASLTGAAEGQITCKGSLTLFKGKTTPGGVETNKWCSIPIRTLGIEGLGGLLSAEVVKVCATLDRESAGPPLKLVYTSHSYDIIDGQLGPSGRCIKVIFSGLREYSEYKAENPGDISQIKKLF